MAFDYTGIEKQFLKYWNRENERPLLQCYAPLNKTPYPQAPDNLSERWLDVDYVLKNARAHMENTYYAGEAYPSYCPNLGPDIMGAVTGLCDLEFGESTSWARPLIESWENVSLSLDENNFWYRKICELTREGVREFAGEYLVGLTDIHPGMDGLVSLRGAENLCMDILDRPELVKRAQREMFCAYRKFLQSQYALLSPRQLGTTNWMGLWHPKKWYAVSCDFSCLIGEEDYENFVAGTIEAEIDGLDASMYHLDGPGAIRHLKRILQMKKLNGVQWVYGAGQPSAQHWLKLLKKIQAAGKNIEITVLPEEVGVLCRELSPEGLLMKCYVSSPQEADDLVKSIQ